MKTVLKFTLLFACVAFANFTFAGGNLKVNIQPISSEKALVAISNYAESSMKITVEDEQGRIVYFKEVSEPTVDYKKVFDFSDLETGEYSLSVESDNLTSECPFVINNLKIEVGKETTRIEPYFGYNDGLFRFSYLNFPKENLSILFYDDDQLLYSKEFGHNFKVTEALNLSKLDKGTYKAVLLAGDKNYTYPITIN